MADEYVKVASLDDLEPGTLLGVEAGDTRLCLANVDGEIYAVEDKCSHKDFPLSAGDVDDSAVTCAWHGARFDLSNGRALSLPAIKPVATFDVKVEDGAVYVAL